VGVCQHNEDSDEDVLAGYRRLVARRGGLRFQRPGPRVLGARDRAQGPVLARYSIKQRPYHGERYYLIDEACIRMWNQACQLALKPILTMYPADFTLFHRRWPARDYEHRPPGYLHFSGFDPDSGLVSIMGADMAH